MKLQTLALDVIRPRPGNRAVGGIDEQELAELTNSVREQGVLTPIHVIPLMEDGIYELVDGERRWLAAGNAGLAKIRALILPANATSEQVELAALVANLQRTDLHPLDECDAYTRLLNAGYSIGDLMQRVGRSRPYIAGRVRLAHLIPEIRKVWESDDSMTLAAADKIARLPVEHQQRIHERATKGASQGWAPWQIENHVTNDTDRLADAPFDIDDPELLEDRPNCGVCPLRIGWQSDLFELVHEGDRCGDRTCWKRKAEAHLSRARADLADANVEYREASTEWNPKVKGAGDDRLLRRGEWEPTNEMDDDDEKEAVAQGAEVQNVLVTDGPDAGKVVRAVVEETEPHDSAAEHRKWMEDREARSARKAEYIAVRKQAMADIAAVLAQMTHTRIKKLMMHPRILRSAIDRLLTFDNAEVFAPLLDVPLDSDTRDYERLQHVRKALDGGKFTERKLLEFMLFGILAQDYDQFDAVDKKESPPDLVTEIGAELEA